MFKHDYMKRDYLMLLTAVNIEKKCHITNWLHRFALISTTYMCLIIMLCLQLHVESINSSKVKLPADLCIDLLAAVLTME